MSKYLLLLIFVAGCTADKWEGWVYPDRTDLTIDVQIGEFDSLESCRASARNLMAQSGWQESGDYECGLNCEYRRKYGLSVCEKTER